MTGTSGSVELFGHAVQRIGFAQLRQMIGIVPQRAVLFTGTIRDNMQWACPDATDEQIWQALEIAQAADFVRGKPKGLDEPVETAGRNFSGGQRQRLTIARALVPHPQVLILDDSSSALDFATDAALRKALKEQTHGMTVFIVSQRASAVQRADRILVLDDGNLVGSGTHGQSAENLRCLPRDLPEPAEPRGGGKDLMSNAKKKRVSLRGSKGTIQRVLKLIQPYRGLVLFTLLLAAVTVLTTLYAPILSGRGVDLIVGQGNVNFPALGKIAIQFGVTVCVTSICQC